MGDELGEWDPSQRGPGGREMKKLPGMGSAVGEMGGEASGRVSKFWGPHA